MLHHRGEVVEARARAADRHQDAHRFPRGEALLAEPVILLEIHEELVVDETADLFQYVAGDPFEGSLGEAREGLVAEIGKRRLNGVDRPFREMETHRPIVGDSIDHVGHPRMHRPLRRPHVSGDIGDVFRDIAEDGDEKLAVFLILGVIGDLLEALRVHRFPHQFIEEAGLLRDTRCEGIEVILLADHLGARGVE